MFNGIFTEKIVLPLDELKDIPPPCILIISCAIFFLIALILVSLILFTEKPTRKQQKSEHTFNDNGSRSAYASRFIFFFQKLYPFNLVISSKSYYFLCAEAHDHPQKIF